MTLRQVAVLVGVIVICAGVCAFVLIRAARKGTPPADSVATSESARMAPPDIAPLIDIAPMPSPPDLPVVGPEGVDSFGYPRRHVDFYALRSLLYFRRFEVVTRAFETWQREFEADYHHENLVWEAALACETAEQEHGERLNAWVASMPGAWAPYLCRANYWHAVGSTLRSQHRDSDEAFDLARVDAETALAKNPRAMEAYRLVIRLASQSHDRAGAEHAMQAANHACPDCFWPRVTYMRLALTPAWGGSHEKMKAFAEQAVASSHNPRLQLLHGYVDADIATRNVRDQSNLDEALAAAQRACAIGDDADFEAYRAEALEARDDFSSAIEALDRAIALDPSNVVYWRERAKLHVRQRQWESAARDQLETLRRDPTDGVAARLHRTLLQGLDREATSIEASDRAKAIELLELEMELAPRDHYPEVHHDQVVLRQIATGDETPTIDAAYAFAAAHPDDIRAVQVADYTLGENQRFSDIMTLWTDFLARHPNDPVAYAERAGAFSVLHRDDDAIADYEKACLLGSNKGCAYRRWLRLSVSEQAKADGGI